MAPDGGAARAKPNTEIVASVCPHDCTSTCALDVERLDAHTIGRVRGSKRNTYTSGVICEKVARYSERVHHPDRLQYPMKRVGPKGSGQFRRIGCYRPGKLTAHAEHQSGAGRRLASGTQQGHQRFLGADGLNYCGKARL